VQCAQKRIRIFVKFVHTYWRYGGIIIPVRPPILYDFMDYLKIPYQRQEEQFRPHIMNRHKISIQEAQEFNYEKINELGKRKKVLVIVNTIKKAQEIYEKLKDNHTHLLHSHYLKQDRNKLEEMILEFGNKEGNDEAGIWISTQIVEASLDIDFDVLFTEMCAIDSLLQRMGRVYRKREYIEKEPNVYILDNKNGVPYIIDSDIYHYTLKELRAFLVAIKTIFTNGPAMRMPYCNKREHLDKVKKVKEKYKEKIKIYKGFEAEYFENYLQYYQSLLDLGEVDYLILGNHFNKYSIHTRYYGKLNITNEEIIRYKNDLINFLVID